MRSLRRSPAKPCLDRSLEHVNGFCAGLEPDAVAPAFADNLRLCQLQITGRRHDDPVALAAHVLQLSLIHI